MKKKYFWLQMILGFALFLTGTITYGLHKVGIIDYKPIGVGVWGIVIAGGILIISATTNGFKKTKQEEIAKKDERNIAIMTKAKAIAFDTMLLLFVVALIILNHTGHMGAVSFFTMVGVLFVIQIIFLVSLRYLQKKM